MVKCQVKGCGMDAIGKVQKTVSKMSSNPEEDYLIRVYVLVCSEHARLLTFGKRELLLSLESK